MADPTGIIINIAIQAAISLAIAALTPKQKIEGPRLDDKQVTTSTYGDEIPIGYGTTIIGGNVIWGTDLEEVSNTQDIGKGSMLSPGTNTTYEYFSTFATAIARREIAAVLRIYADGKIIYDAIDDTTPQTDIMPDLSFTVYHGTRTQQVDPLIEADVGADQAPAYRGIAYVVFNRLPLESFGNRIPQLRFVVSFKESADDRAGYDIANVGEKVSSGETFGYDKERGIIWSETFVGSGTDTSNRWIQAIDASDGALLFSRTYAEISSILGVQSRDMRGLSKGPVILMRSGTSDTAILVVIDKETLTPIANTLKTGTINLRNANVYNDPNDLTWAFEPAGIYVAPGGYYQVVEVITRFKKKYYVLTGNQGGGSTIQDGAGFAIMRLSDDLDALEWVAGSGSGSHQIDGDDGTTIYDGVSFIMEGQQRLGETDAYIFYHDGGVAQTIPHSIYMARYTVGLDVEGQPRNFVLTFPSGVASLFSRFHYDPVRDYMIAELEQYHTICYFMDSANKNTNIEVVWERNGITTGHPWDVEGLGTDVASDDMSAGYYVRYSTTVADHTVFFIDLDTGEVIRTDDRADLSFPGGDGKVVVDDTGMQYVAEGNRLITNYGIYYMDQPLLRSTESLQVVVEDIVHRSKLSASDVDATALATKDVRGYLLGSAMSYRSAIEPLATAFNFYGVEQDGQLVFKFHDATSDITIPEDDLLRSGFENIFEETRGQELESPRSLFITHRSPDQDDLKAVQGARRISTPASTMNSVGEKHLEIPLYLTPDEGAELAERILYETWVQREAVKFRLPHRYLNILPNDTLTVTAEGRTETMRVNRLSVGSALEVEVEGPLVDSEIYTAALPGVAGLGSPNYSNGGKLSQITTRVLGFLHDIPLLKDSHLSDRTSGLMYFSAGKAPTAKFGEFPGASVSTSYNAGAFEGRTSVFAEMAYGILTTTPADIPGPNWNAVQETSISFLGMAQQTEFVSVSQDDMITNDANTALLIRSDGQTEIIGYRDVVESPDNLFTITGLMRGKRGTDTMATGYSGTVYIVLVDSTWMTGFYESPSRDEGSLLYRVLANTRGALDFNTKSKTLKIRSLMPYSPSHVSIAVNGSDYDISWVRRTRQGGYWTYGFGEVPLSEDTESYEIDILDGTGGTVLRTLTSTTETVTYTSAQATTDFGGFPATLYCRVYQMSAQVGRGFSYEAALET